MLSNPIADPAHHLLYGSRIAQRGPHVIERHSMLDLDLLSDSGCHQRGQRLLRPQTLLNQRCRGCGFSD